MFDPLNKANYVSLSVGSGEEPGSHLRSANIQDSSDCVKRLICELNAARGPLDWDEELIQRAVSNRWAKF